MKVPVIRILAVLLLASGCTEAAPWTAAVGTTGYVTSSGIQRRYWLHVPPGKRAKAPLVIVLHGGKGTGRGAVHLSFGAFDRLADRDGFVVVYPDGVDKGWNDGRKDLNQTATRLNVDDVKFLLELVDRLAVEANIDPEKLFCCGISNGGFMSFRLAHDAPGRLRAIASVAANLGAEMAKEPVPSAPVSAMLLLGTADPLVPFEGGDIRVFGVKRGVCLSAVDSMKYWAKLDGCPGKPARSPMPDTDPKDGTRSFRSVWSGCNAGTEVALVTVQGGGHTWPGGLQYLPEAVIGKTSRDFDAAEEIWSFFLRHLGDEKAK